MIYTDKYEINFLYFTKFSARSWSSELEAVHIFKLRGQKKVSWRTYGQNDHIHIIQLYLIDHKFYVFYKISCKVFLFRVISYKATWLLTPFLSYTFLSDKAIRSNGCRRFKLILITLLATSKNQEQTFDTSEPINKKVRKK